MRIVAIGDIHGRNGWKQIINKEKFERVVFIGDYFDSFEGISSEVQKENFADIITFKKANPDRAILLIGNHDFHYLKTTYETYSGYQENQKEEIQKLLQQAIDENLLQMCFVFDKLLFSHAGVTQTWCNNNRINILKIEKSINDLFKKKPSAFRFAMGKNKSTDGEDFEQSPIWVRPYSLWRDAVEGGFTQIAGHTQQPGLLINADVILIDTLGTSIEYLVYDSGKFTVRKLLEA